MAKSISLKNNEPKKLSPQVFEGLRDLIYRNSGIFFPESKQGLLENSLALRLDQLQLGSFDAYLVYLHSLNQLTDELREKKIYEVCIE